MTDITNFVNWFISAMVDLFSFIFNTLDSISFLGITLLDFVITIFILMTAVPLVVTILSNNVHGAHSAYRSEVTYQEHRAEAKAERAAAKAQKSGTNKVTK